MMERETFLVINAPSGQFCFVKELSNNGQIVRLREKELFYHLCDDRIIKNFLTYACKELKNDSLVANLKVALDYLNAGGG